MKFPNRHSDLAVALSILWLVVLAVISGGSLLLWILENKPYAFLLIVISGAIGLTCWAIHVLFGE